MQSKAILFALIMITGMVNAQADKVYLKNRGLIMGKTLSLNRDSVLVSFNDKKHWFRTDDIQRMSLKSRNESGVDYDLQDSLNESSLARRLDRIILGGVMIGGGGNNRDVYPSVSLMGSYRFSRLLQFGLATGYEQYDNYNNVPVYVYYKGDLFRRFSRLYCYAGVGYGKMWSNRNMEQRIDKVKGGTLFKLGFGFIFDTKSKVDFVTALGWSRQEMEEEYPTYHTWGGEWKTVVARTMNRLELKIGICF